MTYVATARAVADLVSRIPEGAWEGPGLGDWTLRELVGHTSRSLVTVIEYFARPEAEERLPDAADYYVAIGSLGRATSLDHTVSPEALEEAAELAARVAARTGHGAELLLALTGRQPLPDGFSVV